MPNVDESLLDEFNCLTTTYLCTSTVPKAFKFESYNSSVFVAVNTRGIFREFLILKYIWNNVILILQIFYSSKMFYSGD